MKIKTLTIASWNINSVRLRVDKIKKFLQQQQIDILCLQEIKCENEQFPTSEFQQIGYQHFAISGQKAYHGVAIISKYPLEIMAKKKICQRGESRHQEIIIETNSGKVGIHNFYVPAGGEIADENVNEKFAHKLDFLHNMKKLKSVNRKKIPYILLGDLNIAPLEQDVWSHQQLLNVVSHTPIECETLMEIMQQGKWHDGIRHIYPNKKLYTWWSYRSRDWQIQDKGRRLDHIWLAGELLQFFKKIAIVKQARGWQQPSDHVPIIAYFEF